MKRFSSLISLVLLLIFMVNSPGVAREKAPSCPLAFGMKSFERRSSNNIETWCKCTYPVFAASPIGEAINLTLMAGILSSIPLPESKPVPLNLEDAATAFFETSEEGRAKNQQSWPWQAEVSVQVLVDRPDLVTLSISSFAFTRGSIGLNTTHYLMFNSQSGRLLGLNDFFIPGFETKLDALIENRFRQIMGLAEGEPLSGERGGLAMNTLPHTTNFAVAGTGMVFMYNPFELGPDLADPLRIELSFDELREILYPLKELKSIEQ
ncbi:MAG: DUF3298 domain-containing protein [Chlorobiaceae bacterium]|nr:DUF3298 domain-containing protein [Chlorobiaceae bacterium]